MAVTPVSLGPSLRAWALAGMTHILCDGAVDSIFLGENVVDRDPATPPASVRQPLSATPPPLPSRPGQASARPAVPASSNAPRSAPPTVVPSGAPERAAAAAAPAAGPGKEPQDGESADGAGRVSGTTGTAGASGVTVPGALAFAPRDGAPANPAAWPEPWAGWFAKIVPAPVLWTYHELGADLTGIGRSPERSQFFKNLIGELRLPKGSSVFWPSAMPVADAAGNAALRECPPVFSSGLARLMPQIVVVFGEAALADIGLAGKVQPLRQAMVEGKLLLCLPEIAVLLHDQGQRATAVSLLRAVLGSVNFG